MFTVTVLDETKYWAAASKGSDGLKETQSKAPLQQDHDAMQEPPESPRGLIMDSGEDNSGVGGLQHTALASVTEGLTKRTISVKELGSQICIRSYIGEEPFWHQPSTIYLSF
jgi:hypothetical protein